MSYRKKIPRTLFRPGTLINNNEYNNNEFWWFGPRWLSQEIEHWPTVKGTVENLPEERQSRTTCGLTAGTKAAENPFDRFSSYSRLRRVFAYCLRFMKKLVNRIRKGITAGTTSVDEQYLTSKEIAEAEFTLVRLAQREVFSKEIVLLASNRSLSNKGNLISLNPFLDNSGILRVGGRLLNAPIVYDHKHPMILASDHPLTILLIEYEHRRLLHAGCQHTLASLRTRFWPISGKRVVRKVLH